MTPKLLHHLTMPAACIMLSLLPNLAHAEMFQCKSASGAVSFQEMPCPSTDAQKIVQNPKPAQKPSEAGPGESADEAGIAFRLTVKASCDLSLPNFKSQSENVYARWRQTHLQVIQKIEKMSEAREAMTQQAMQWAKARKNLPVQQQSGECDRLMADMEEATRAPDPRLNSAEKTWQIFVDALKIGDRKLVLACLTMTARDQFKSFLLTAPQEELKRMGNSVKSIHFDSHFEPFKTAMMARDNGTGGEIQFVHKGAEWLISGM